MFSFLIALLSGVGLMYLLDPQEGKRRRAQLRDQWDKFQNQAQSTAEATQKQLEDRAQGMVAETRSMMENAPVSDETLVARVRSELGRVVSNVGAVDVSASGGRVTLRGNILADEVSRVMQAVRMVQGVTNVDNQLRIYQDPGNMPDLQGGKSSAGTSTGRATTTSGTSSGGSTTPTGGTSSGGISGGDTPL